MWPSLAIVAEQGQWISLNAALEMESEMYMLLVVRAMTYGLAVC